MRAIILGAGGQLGYELVSDLSARGHEVVALGREQLDITNPDRVARGIKGHEPDWVINAAAYNKVDLAEKEPQVAMEVNGLAVRSLAAACGEANATFVHFSTDHVFDGTKTEPYTEADLPSPPSAYAVSKLAGEFYARIYCENLYLFRVAGVFGPAGRYTRHGNFPELILRKAREGSPLNVVEDFFVAPTYAPALAARVIDALEKKIPFGLYHIGGGVSISWYHWALKILDQTGLRAKIQPTNHREYKTPARRPRYAGLSNAKIEAAGISPMPSLDDAVTEYLRRREKVQPPKQ
ncbi:MAG: dTDP-4-dehydrorhamnose reductase [Acidobacteria bacterium]|nr:dTDP-4-dehydrorhamnose reductase [Acidobacteriota bacterium]